MPKTKNIQGIHLYKIRRLKPTRKKNGTKTNLVMADHWFWHIVSSNGRIIARSSETYSRKAGAKKSIIAAATIFLGAKPYALIEYYDHSKPDCPLISYL